MQEDTTPEASEFQSTLSMRRATRSRLCSRVHR